MLPLLTIVCKYINSLGKVRISQFVSVEVATPRFAGLNVAEADEFRVPAEQF